MDRNCRLIDYYLPPGEGFVLESLVATTYQMDFDFFEEELLAAALGVRSPVSRMKAFRSELERKLQKVEVSVLYDLGGCDRLARPFTANRRHPCRCTQAALKNHSSDVGPRKPCQWRTGRSTNATNRRIGESHPPRVSPQLRMRCFSGLWREEQFPTVPVDESHRAGSTDWRAVEEPTTLRQLAAFSEQADLLPDGITGPDDRRHWSPATRLCPLSVMLGQRSRKMLPKR